MKLKHKITLSYAAVLLSFALLFFIFTNLFLDRFYIQKKRKKLFDVFESVQEYVNTYDDSSYDLFFRGISDISSNNDAVILVYDLNGLNIDDRPTALLKDLKLLEIVITINDDEILLDTKQEYDKYISEDGLSFEIGSDDIKKNIAVIGKLLKDDEPCGYVLIYTSYTSVKENTGIFNIFVVYTTIVLLIITVIISYVLSNNLTKPLNDVKNKAKKMANLDFSTKLGVYKNDEIGQLAASMNILSDELEISINELKEANEKLENDIKLKEKINRLREEFISDVSHELKTPISIIGGYSEALKLEGLSQDDINEYADIIIDESKRMNKLVRDLLKFTQIESGFISLDKEEFQVLELLNEIIKPNELRLQEKKVTLNKNIIDATVIGDFDMMETVFNNIFVNAINHVDNERIITVDTEIINDKYRVTVTNTGEKIEEDKQSRIWESFYKVDKSRSRQYGGSGLGLAIVKSIMTTYNNDFGTYNTDNGVAFYFDLDLKQESDEERGTENE